MTKETDSFSDEHKQTSQNEKIDEKIVVEIEIKVESWNETEYEGSR